VPRLPLLERREYRWQCTGCMGHCRFVAIDDDEEPPDRAFVCPNCETPAVEVRPVKCEQYTGEEPG